MTGTFGAWNVAWLAGFAGLGVLVASRAGWILLPLFRERRADEETDASSSPPPR